MRQKILPHSKLVKTKRLPTLKSFRRLVINDQEYRYRIGSGGVRIVTPDGKNISVDMSTFSGWTWNDIERGYWKRYFKVTPKDVRNWIEEHGL